MILADMGKFVGGKVATALIFAAIAGGGFWCYQHPEVLKAGWSLVKLTLMWLVVAASLPWSSYLFMQPLLARQAQMHSHRTAGALGILIIAAFTLLDVLFALHLADGSIHGSFTWLVVILGFAAAAAYNFVICESLARQASA